MTGEKCAVAVERNSWRNIRSKADRIGQIQKLFRAFCGEQSLRADPAFPLKLESEGCGDDKPRPKSARSLAVDGVSVVGVRNDERPTQRDFEHEPRRDMRQPIAFIPWVVGRAPTGDDKGNDGDVPPDFGVDAIVERELYGQRVVRSVVVIHGESRIEH